MSGELTIVPQFFLTSPDALAEGFRSGDFASEAGLTIVSALTDSYIAAESKQDSIAEKLDAYRTLLGGDRDDLKGAFRILGPKIAREIRRHRRSTFEKLLPRVRFQFQIFEDNRAVAARARTTLVSLADLEPEIEYLPRYQGMQVLWVGEVATVYRAEERSTGKQVVIKSLSDRRFHREFNLEVRILRRLHHPHIAKLIEEGNNFGEAVGVAGDSLPFFVMEYVSHESLEDRRQAQDSFVFTWDQTRIIAKQLADALGHLHSKGIIHRDLKPDNVIFQDNGKGGVFVRLIDFSHARDLGNQYQIAKERGRKIGTPDYMSPEQINAGDIDARADIYALGVLLFEMLTGELPFTGRTEEEIMRQHLNDAPRLPRSVSPDLEIPTCAEAIILKALAKVPADRFQTMAEMAEAIEACR